MLQGRNDGFIIVGRQQNVHYRKIWFGLLPLALLFQALPFGFAGGKIDFVMQPALFIYPAQGIFIYFFESAFVLFGLFLKIFRALLHADGGGAVKCAAVIVQRSYNGVFQAFFEKFVQFFRVHVFIFVVRGFKSRRQAAAFVLRFHGVGNRRRFGFCAGSRNTQA